MSRQGLMDDSGYMGFVECSKYESCTEDAYNDGYEKGATDMENAKQIIIDALLKQLEVVRVDAIDDCIKLVGGNTKTIVGIVFDNSIPIHDRALGRMAKNKLIEELVEQLEELKEQNK